VDVNYVVIIVVVHTIVIIIIIQEFPRLWKMLKITIIFLIFPL